MNTKQNCETCIVFDIEANGLLMEATKVWCVVAKELGKEGMYEFYPDEISEAISYLSSADRLIGHNIIGYDLPVLYRLHNFDHSGIDRRDTMIMSYLLNPDRGYHSLEDWAVKLGGIQKKQHEDWTQFSQDMMERCKSDVLITERVYNCLMEEWNRS